MRATLRILLAAAMMLIWIQPASAQLKQYSIYGDSSTHFPTDGDILRPRTVGGLVEIDDSGASPVLKTIELRIDWADIVSGDTTCCTGSTVELDVRAIVQVNIPGEGITGTGTTATSISWGTITGWGQLGQPRSRTICRVNNDPGGACPSCVTSCTQFLGGCKGTIGAGIYMSCNSPDLTASSYDTDPWTFQTWGSSTAFSAPSIKFVDIGGGLVTSHFIIAGYRIDNIMPVPTLPLVGLGILGVAFLGVGAHTIRKRNR